LSEVNIRFSKSFLKKDTICPGNDKEAAPREPAKGFFLGRNAEADDL